MNHATFHQRAKMSRWFGHKRFAPGQHVHIRKVGLVQIILDFILENRRRKENHLNGRSVFALLFVLIGKNKIFITFSYSTEYIIVLSIEFNK